MVMMAREANKQNDAPLDMVAKFELVVGKVIRQKGIFPYPCMYLGYNDSLNICAIAAPEPMAALDFFQQQISSATAREIVLGLDRVTKPGQGTEFGDVLTCYYWKDRSSADLKANWRSWYKTGVINYQFSPLTVRSMDWKNAYWNEVLGSDINKVLLKYGLAKKAE